MRPFIRIHRLLVSVIILVAQQFQYHNETWCNVEIMSRNSKAEYLALTAALIGWLRGTVVERRSSAGVLSLSCARPVADG